MQPPAKGHQSCCQTELPPRGAFRGGTALPAWTRLQERMHSRCLKSPRLVICYPRHKFRGCLRQESGLAQTWGANMRLHVWGTSVTQIQQLRTNPHVHQKNGTQHTWQAGAPEGKRRTGGCSGEGGSRWIAGVL